MEYRCWKRLSTVRGSSSFATIHETENTWLDVGDFDDAVFYINLQEVTGTVTLTLDTAPLKDTDAFISALPAGLLLSPGVIVTAIVARTASPPIAKWMRWTLMGTGTFDATFSIDVALR